MQLKIFAGEVLRQWPNPICAVNLVEITKAHLRFGCTVSPSFSKTNYGSKGKNGRQILYIFNVLLLWVLTKKMREAGTQIPGIWWGPSVHQQGC